jgi:hypothetical protein
MNRLIRYLIIIAPFFFNASNAESFNISNINDAESVPPSGLGATTIGERIIIYNNGTWKINNFFKEEQVPAITDHGRTILLSKKTNPENNKTTLHWEYTDQSSGPIQILISRAIDTRKSEHSSDDNCIPVVTARNLSMLTLFRVIAEITFTTPDGVSSSTSVMLGPLDRGEEEEKVSSPIFVNNCQELSATLHVAYCFFSNGLDCSKTVVASRFGTIPIQETATQ